MTEINHLKNKHAVHVDDKAVKYLNTVKNAEVYPAARCHLSKSFCMYRRLSSSSAESMNKANQAARAKMAVDVVSSTIAATRYKGQKEQAWKWDNILTPHN